MDESYADVWCPNMIGRVLLILACIKLSLETNSSDTESEENDIVFHIGRSMNLLSRFGFLSLSVKVFPQESPWIFKDETKEVFQPSSYKIFVEPSNSRGKYDNFFLIDFCDNLKQLLEAYFDRFHVEGVDQPHRLFTPAMSTSDASEYFGIHGTYFEQHYSFVLIRLLKRDDKKRMAGQPEVTAEFEAALEEIRVGSQVKAMRFFDDYGTHIIEEFETGDMIFQVYIFGPMTYSELKATFESSKDNHDTLKNVYRYFYPNVAAHVGKVKLASGNPDFTSILESQAGTFPFFLFSYEKNIFDLFKESAVEKHLNEMDGKIVLGMKLVKVTKAIRNSTTREWIKEILDNTLTLFYFTM